MLSAIIQEAQKEHFPFCFRSAKYLEKGLVPAASGRKITRYGRSMALASLSVLEHILAYITRKQLVKLKATNGGKKKRVHRAAHAGRSQPNPLN